MRVALAIIITLVVAVLVYLLLKPKAAAQESDTAGANQGSVGGDGSPTITRNQISEFIAQMYLGP